ncbi:MAG: hypothetical protein B6D61_01205 [Bacteroidetes bacterium 4484_249]|nr:MAG: hypothetical protein B6D61_01205 [Bacteroidetes bacterium 4484_249]
MNSNILKRNKNEILKLSVIQKLSILSLDVVLGSLAGGFFVVKLFNVYPDFVWWIILPVSVWIVYTLDHLIDAFKLKNKGHTTRHLFHFYYSSQIIIVLILLTIINLLLIGFYLEKQIIYFGFIAGGFAVVYLLFVYFVKNKKTVFLQKEFFVALIYTVGIWGGPAALLGYNLNSTQIVFLIVFFLIAFADILIFSLYEEKTDRIDKHNSFAVNYGSKLTTDLIYILITVAFVLCIYEIIFESRVEFIFASKIFMLMGLIQLVIMSYPAKFKKNDLYRFIGEMVFWLPWLALLF